MAPPLKPEVAFIGRSNVGKSSLINALTGHTKLARASKTPGRTGQLNFFEVGGPDAPRPSLMLVDLPGYGYISGPEELGHEWSKLIRAYLLEEQRRELRVLLLLLDARRILTPLDIAMMEMLEECQQPFQVVFTKCDQVGPAVTSSIVKGFLEHEAPQWPHLDLPLAAVSAKKKVGIQELRTMLVQQLFLEGARF